MDYYVKDIQKRNIAYFIKNLDNKILIQTIKNLYQIYNMLFNTILLINRNKDFNILDSRTNNFYNYLTTSTISLKEEIYSYIRLIYEEDNLSNN